jgi:phospholipase/carboxylesterase
MWGMTADPAWPLPIEWLPQSGRAEQLILLLHGWAQNPSMFLPLAQALRQQFPQAAILAPEGPHPADGGQLARQWYSIADIGDEVLWRQRVQASLGPLEAWVRLQQQRLDVAPAATALGGFSQGGLLALHTAMQVPGIVGRVLAFGARMVDLPDAVPQQTTFHFFHGAKDRIFALEDVRTLFNHIGALQGDATLDIAQGLGHEMHPALVDCLMHQLTHHIPLRTWQAALGGASPAQPSSGDSRLLDH